MTTVKFDKSVKYGGVRHPAHTVFTVEDSDVEELRKAGATVLSTDVVHTVAEPQCGSSEVRTDSLALREQLLSYSVRELTEYAKAHDIDLNGKTRKADIYNIIVMSIN